MKAIFVGITYIRNGRFVEIAEPGTKPRNVIGTSPSGTTIYVSRETRVMLILAAPGAKKISVNIYPTLRKMFPYRKVNEGLINTLRKRLNKQQFEVENGQILNLEEKLRIIE